MTTSYRAARINVGLGLIPVAALGLSFLVPHAVSDVLGLIAAFATAPLFVQDPHGFVSLRGLLPRRRRRWWLYVLAVLFFPFWDMIYAVRLMSQLEGLRQREAEQRGRRIRRLERDLGMR